jgi:hypothetical protein
MAEQLTLNQWVEGSSPSGLTMRSERHRSALRSLFLVLGALLMSCQSTPSGATAEGSAAEASAAAAAARLVWGPLAVMPPQDGADTGRAQGTLLITDACVYLVFRGQKTLLFWPADRTRWNAEEHAILFSNFDGTMAAASDGDAVVVGGGGDSQAESGISGDVWASHMVWVAPPDPSCSAERRWGVGALGR